MALRLARFLARGCFLSAGEKSASRNLRRNSPRWRAQLLSPHVMSATTEPSNAALREGEEQFGEIKRPWSIMPRENFMARRKNSRPMPLMQSWESCSISGTFRLTQVLASAGISAKLGETAQHRDYLCGGQLRLGIRRAFGLREAGLLAMTTSLAVEWAKYHIRLNAHRAGTVSDRRSVVALDAVKAV